MADVEYLMFCQEVSIDDDTDQLSLVGIMEYISGTAFPFQADPWAIVIWCGGDANEDLSIGIELLRPNGQPVGRMGTTVRIGMYGVGFVHAVMRDVIFQEPGDHLVRISASGVPQRSKVLPVYLQSDPLAG